MYTAIANYQQYLNSVEGNHSVSLVKVSSSSPQVLNSYCSEQFKEQGSFLPLGSLGHSYPCFKANHI